MCQRIKAMNYSGLLFVKLSETKLSIYVTQETSNGVWEFSDFLGIWFLLDATDEMKP